MKDTSIFSREEWGIIVNSLVFYKEQIESLNYLEDRLEEEVTDELDMLAEIIAVVHEQF